MRYLQRRGICISVTVEPVQHGCVDLDLEQRCVYSARLSVCTFVVESYVRLLSLAEIETRGSRVKLNVDRLEIHVTELPFIAFHFGKLVRRF